MTDKRDFSSMSESDVIIKYIKERHNKGLYTLIMTTGLPGTGKSSVDQRLAELISLAIHGENKIILEDIMDNLLELIRFTKTADYIGKIGIIEEVSVLFGSRRAMAQENVAVARILDTCRKKQVIILANAPIFTSVDSHVRSMAHILIETISINKTENVVIFKAWKLQTNPHTGKTYRHTFTRDGKDVNLFFTRKPNSKVWDEYEDKKDNFLDDLYNKLEKAQEQKDKKMNKLLGIKEKKKVVKQLTETEIRRLALKNQGLTLQEIADKEGTSFQSIHNSLKNIEKKTNISL